MERRKNKSKSLRESYICVQSSDTGLIVWLLVLALLPACLPIRTDCVFALASWNRQWKSGKPYISASRTDEKKTTEIELCALDGGYHAFEWTVRNQFCSLNVSFVHFFVVVSCLFISSSSCLQLCATSFYSIQTHTITRIRTTTARRISHAHFYGLNVKQCHDLLFVCTVQRTQEVYVPLAMQGDARENLLCTCICMSDLQCPMFEGVSFRVSSRCNI